jgi:hypothetical protein
MTIIGMTLTGFLFFAATVALFAWGVAIGLKGAFAEAPEFTQGGHAPGAAGTYDPRYTTGQGAKAA